MLYINHKLFALYRMMTKMIIKTNIIECCKMQSPLSFLKSKYVFSGVLLVLSAVAELQLVWANRVTCVEAVI